jgi:5-methylcytosine-specific restriction protein B
MNQLINFVHDNGVENWSDKAKSAFAEIYGASGGRYPDKANKVVTLRAPEFRGGAGVPFASLIHPSNPDSGAYGGFHVSVALSFNLTPASPAVP